jgi:heme-degrading monooxygenase HmoA
MIEVLYRYRVHPAQVRAFEHAYGQTGPWVALFSRHPGYRRTRLFRHKSETGVYICMDVWDSKADWDGFRTQHAQAYAQLDRDLHLLYVEELLLGYYEGEEEYQPSLDSTV